MLNKYSMPDKISKIFNSYRFISLFIILFASILLWYSVILMTSPITRKPIPSKFQLYGLVLTVFISIVGWISECLTIKLS